MMKKLFQILRTFFGLNKKHIDVIEVKQSNSADLIQAATTELVTRPQQVKEDRWFKQANNIIDEFQDTPALLYTPMGNYYGENDPRNTYDPNIVHEIEDYDGTILRIGGKGFGIKEVKTMEDREPDDMPSNPELVAHIEKLRAEWREKNKANIDYTEALKLKPEKDE